MKPLVEAQLYRDAGAIKRYHVKRTLRQQTVAEHTFGVLMLVKQVAVMSLSHQDLVAVYETIMHHDLPELFTGDVPAPIKRAHPELGPLLDRIESELHPLYQDYQLEPHMVSLCKWADRMELVLWCLEEVRMGNTFCTQTVRRGLGWILASHIPDCAKTLTNEVVADALSVGIEPATGAELEMNA